MSKVRLKVTLNRRQSDADGISAEWADDSIPSSISVDESEYEVLDVDITDLNSDDTSIYFTAEIELQKSEGKFVSNSDLADALMGEIGDEFMPNEEGYFDVEVEEL